MQGETESEAQGETGKGERNCGDGRVTFWGLGRGSKATSPYNVPWCVWG